MCVFMYVWVVSLSIGVCCVSFGNSQSGQVCSHSSNGVVWVVWRHCRAHRLFVNVWFVKWAESSARFFQVHFLRVGPLRRTDLQPYVPQNGNIF